MVLTVEFTLYITKRTGLLDFALNHIDFFKWNWQPDDVIINKEVKSIHGNILYYVNSIKYKLSHGNSNAFDMDDNLSRVAEQVFKRKDFFDELRNMGFDIQLFIYLRADMQTQGNSITIPVDVMAKLAKSGVRIEMDWIGNQAEMSSIP